MYYEGEAPKPHDDTPVGRAVAASAAVPGLFSPVKLSGVYPDRDVELVDGGVHDNQGVGGLREQDCTVLLISDASGQLLSELRPARNEASVLMRTNNTLMARVRELEHKELCARKRAGLVRGFMFLHLKKDLLVEPVNWNDCDLPKESKPRPGARPDSDDLTRFGVRGNVQNLLSGIRTDLDAFSDAEAYALMASGYKMTDWDFANSITSFKPHPDKDKRWRFLQLDLPMSNPRNTESFIDALRLGGSLLFKGPKLHPANEWWRRLGWLRFLPVVFIGALFVALFWVFPVVMLGLLVLAAVGLNYFIKRGGLYRATRRFDRLYLEKGALAKILPPPEP